MNRTGLVFSVLLASLAVCAPAQANGNQATVKLLTDVAVYANPDPSNSDKAVATVKATTPLTSAPTVLPVLAEVDTEHGRWVRVRLPKRPNGSTGWISGAATQAGSTPWKITVNRRTRMAQVTKRGRRVKNLRIVVGAKATPTPSGTFFVSEVVQQPKGAEIGPYALATSAYSTVLQEFAGGPGQIAMHGRTGLRDPLGSAASHGCIRFSDASVTWLAKNVIAGTSIIIIH